MTDTSYNPEDREVIKAFMDVVQGRKRNCLLCQHFDEQAEACWQPASGGARPPARVIAYGCPRFQGEPPF